MARKKCKWVFYIRSSPAILYNFLTTPEGLSQWFADKVDIKGNTYYFWWDGSEETADLLASLENEYVRFFMEDNEDEEYLEFRIEKEEISNDTTLHITQFLDEEDEEAEALFWDSLVDKLTGSIGGKN
ncbi:MAG: START-like domain-containing protein [Chitinophagales bacterium]|nr:hypothetical protein [Bacteroidota bacterium]MCB9043744.1 hypothetical protein [Chitinophagales bacterium]